MAAGARFWRSYGHPCGALAGYCRRWRGGGPGTPPTTAHPQTETDLDRHAAQFQKTNRCIPIVIVENLIATRTIAWGKKRND
jgi:hypothetical protein